MVLNIQTIKTDSRAQQAANMNQDCAAKIRYVHTVKIS